MMNVNLANIVIASQGKVLIAPQYRIMMKERSSGFVGLYHAGSRMMTPSTGWVLLMAAATLS